MSALLQQAVMMALNAAPVGYNKWRLLISANNNNGGACALIELELRGVIGGSDLTDPTTALTAATSSSFLSGNEPYKAFDNQLNTGWAVSMDGGAQWLEYDFALPVNIVEYAITPLGSANIPSQAPMDWQLQYFDGTSWVTADRRVGETSWSILEQRVYNTYSLPAIGKNVALRGTITGSNSWASLSQPFTVITNGLTDSSGYAYMDPTSGLVYCTVDLGLAYSIDQVIIWHYYADGRTYADTKTEVSADGINWVTIFDSVVSGTYAETSSGRTTNFSQQPVRYIRDYGNGSGSNGVTHWVEIQASRQT